MGSRVLSTMMNFSSFSNVTRAYRHPVVSSRQGKVFTGQAKTQRQYTTRTRAIDDDDVELAVFRFTLGIPGFDDALIPRVVGLVGAFVLLLNHVLTGEEVSQSQSFTEVLGLILAGVGIAAPDLQKTIEESTPGKGRRPPLENVEGATNVFAILDSLSEAQKQEAAWASFAIIKNANVCGIYICLDDVSIICRGSLGADISGDNCLEKAFAEITKIPKGNTMEYFDTRSKIDSSSYNSCRIIPSGAGGVAILPLVPIDENNTSTLSGYMVLICDREKAMSPKELAWCRSVASKLYYALMMP